jgi:hypothetical protein
MRVGEEKAGGIGKEAERALSPCKLPDTSEETLRI